jgi:hypothetical protein
MRIKDRISALVASQLPEHIRDSYPKFVRLLEVYYEFLEQDQGAFEIVQNAQSYLDIDRTTQSFIEYFLVNYAKGINSLSILDKSILVKRIKDLYESKGSELSFQLLFRMLYDEDIEIKYPYENVLKPSDGIWDQKISIHLLKNFGNVSIFNTRVAVYKKDGIRYEFVVSRAKELTNDYCELFLETKYNTIPFTIGDRIYAYDGDDVIFDGSIVPTATSYLITSKGSGFKVGQIISINFGGAVDTLVKVGSVDSFGGIKSLTIINFGYGYTQNTFVVELWNSLQFAVRSSFLQTKTNGFREDVTISLIGNENDSNRYFAEDYVRVFSPDSELPYSNPYFGSDRYFDTDYTTFDIIYDEPYQNYVAVSDNHYTANNILAGGDRSDDLPDDVAVIQFSVGTKARYPGQYISFRGFTSEFDIRLQDDKLYQPFAYQIQTNIDISTFYDTVKKIVHQAGTNLFSNRTLQNLIDLSGNVRTSFISNIFIELHDYITVYDSAIPLFQRILTDIAHLSDTIVISRPHNVATDFVHVTDTASPVLHRFINDSVLTIDFETVEYDKIQNEFVSVVDNLSFIPPSTTTDFGNISENIAVTYNRGNIVELLAVTDTFVLTRTQLYFDTGILSDNINIVTNKSIIELINTIDNSSRTISKGPVEISTVSDIFSFVRIANFIDTATVSESMQIYMSNYTSENYFSELYTGSLVN